MSQSNKNDVGNIAHDLHVELFPDLTELEFEYILWNYTGFPCFFIGDPAIYLRKQLEDYKKFGAKSIDEQLERDWEEMKKSSI